VGHWCSHGRGALLGGLADSTVAMSVASGPVPHFVAEIVATAGLVLVIFIEEGALDDESLLESARRTRF
jgi:hypothetical protein